MTLAAADMDQAFSRITSLEVWEALAIGPLYNRIWEPELASKNKTTIQRPGKADVAYANRTRSANWSAATERTADQVELQINRYVDEALLIPWEDQVEAPIDYIDRTRAEMALSLADKLDSELLIDTSGARGIVDQNYAAAQKFTTGSGADDVMTLLAPNYFKGKGDELPRQALKTALLRFQRANAFSNRFLGAAGIGNRWALMAPEMFDVLMTDILATGFALDVLTDDILRDGAVFGSDAYSGTFMKWPLIVSNRIAVPAAGSDFKAYFGTTAAMTYAQPSSRVLTQYFPPEQNQVSEKPGHLLRQTVGFGSQRMYAPFIQENTLETTNT